MIQQENPVVLTSEDYQLLRRYTGSLTPRPGEQSLSGELSRAIIVRKDALPGHTVRINSAVTVLDLDTGREMTFTLVLPELADMRQNKVSILTPIGAALIGFRKGEEVSWPVPAGLKHFRILEVIHPKDD